MVSADLGPDAVILAVQELPGKGLFRRRGRRVCVTAGAEGRADGRRARDTDTAPAGASADAFEREMSRIESEMVARLFSRGVPPDVAGRWAARALGDARQSPGPLSAGRSGTRERTEPPRLGDAMARLRELISSDLQIGTDGRRGPNVSVVVGPCGAGKTTSAVKLALREARAGRSVRLVSLDEGHPSSEVLPIYARDAGLPCLRTRSVGTVRALAESTGDHDHIFVDTEGQSPGQLSRVQELSRKLRALGRASLHLVLPATMSVPDMLGAAKTFASFGCSDLLFTHVDEASCMGGSVAVATDLAMPISFLGTGPDVTTDVVVADASGLAAMVVGA